MMRAPWSRMTHEPSRRYFACGCPPAAGDGRARSPRSRRRHRGAHASSSPFIRTDVLEPDPGTAEDVVQSTPLYHFFDSSERVPSACMSSTIWLTASLRLCASARVVLVERDRQRLVVERVADDLDRAAVVDERLDRLLGADRRVAPHAVAERQVVQRVGVGRRRSAGSAPGIWKSNGGRRRAEHQVALHVVLVRRRHTHADRLAGQVGGTGDRRVVAGHRDRRRRVVVRRREVEELLAVDGVGHRPDAHVPPVVPRAGGDDVPLLRLDVGRDAEAARDLVGDVDVEPVPLLGLHVVPRLRLVLRVGRDAERAARADVGERIAGGRVRRGADAGAGPARRRRRRGGRASVGARHADDGEHREAGEHARGRNLLM